MHNIWIIGLVIIACCLIISLYQFIEIKKPSLLLMSPYNNFILERLLLSEKNWNHGVNLRHDYIKEKKGIEHFNPWGDVGFTVIWNLFAPTFDCPYLKTRAGFIGDGGKWLCGLEVFQKTEVPCVVYSFGVSMESSFEAEILKNTNCEIFSYDMTVKTMGPEIPLNNPRVHFHKIRLGTKNTHRRSKNLRTLMNENGHAWIDILKVDVEGAEFSVFDEILDNFVPLPFGQILIEMHLYEHAINISDFYKWFERLESAGLRAFSNEINLNPCIYAKISPVLIEYSFINVNVEHALIPKEYLSISRQ